MTNTQQPRVTKLVVFGPLDEAYLHDDLGMDPVGAQAWEADGFGKRRLFDLEAIELGGGVRSGTRATTGVTAGAGMARVTVGGDTGGGDIGAGAAAGATGFLVLKGASAKRSTASGSCRATTELIGEWW